MSSQFMRAPWLVLLLVVTTAFSFAPLDLIAQDDTPMISDELISFEPDSDSPALYSQGSNSCCADNCCDQREEKLFDNLSLTFALDGSKQPQDLGINAHFGGRAAANWGFPILRDWGIGGQIGSAMVYSDSAVMVMEVIEGTDERVQNFSTIGVFQRLDSGLSWGFGYDYLTQHYYDQVDLSQWRGRVGYELSCTDEIGGWFTIADRGDRGNFGATPIDFQPIDLGNLYWRHTWENHIQTTVWAGIANGHAESIIVLPTDSTPTKQRFTFGADLFVPLNDHLAITGEANFISPSDTGTVDAYLGFAFYPAGTAKQVRRNQFAPMLPVASSPTFSVDARR